MNSDEYPNVIQENNLKKQININTFAGWCNEKIHIISGNENN